MTLAQPEEARQANPDPIDEALQTSASSLRSPRMFDARDTSPRSKPSPYMGPGYSLTRIPG